MAVTGFQPVLYMTKNCSTFIPSSGTERVITAIATGGEDIRASVDRVLKWVEGTRIYQLAKDDLVEELLDILNQQEMESLQEVLVRMDKQLEEDMAPLRDNPVLIWLAVLSGHNINTVWLCVSQAKFCTPEPFN